MSQKKIRKVSIQLNPIQMVWLHGQHEFQKIQQKSLQRSNQIKFYKNNNGVQIRYQRMQGDPQQLLKARDQLLNKINSNQIRLINTSVHKDIYIRISKEARKQFPKSYIIFLHYQTFENCCRKLQDKFNITSITPELQKLRKVNPYFCFLIAEKQKIDDIQKFSKRIFHSQVSCASTTFSHRRQPPANIPYKRTMSVSSLKGSFSDHNQQQYRLSIHPNPIQQQLFQMSESIMVKLSIQQMQKVKQNNLYLGCKVSTIKYQGPYSLMKRKLYFANRLQLTANPYMQPIYAYSMQEYNPYLWTLTLITDKSYKKLSHLIDTQWMMNYKNKIETLIKVGKAMIILHNNMQTYSGLSIQTVLLDQNKNISLLAAIQKEIPPHTNPFVYDIRKYLLLIYRLFTDTQLSYDMLIFKQQKQQYFCTLSHRSKNQMVKQFLDQADQLFIGQIDLNTFINHCEKFRYC